MSTSQSVAFTVPLLPGKTEQDRAAMTSCWRGERSEEYAGSRRRHGFKRESVWIQSTPGGDFAVVYVEADDLAAAYGGLGASGDPIDRWFRDHVREVHGLDLEDGLPPLEQVMDFRA